MGGKFNFLLMENNNEKVKIATLETHLKNLDRRFTRFVDNDFEHLRKDVRELKNWLFFGFIGLMGVSVVAQIILKLYG